MKLLLSICFLALFQCYLAQSTNLTLLGNHKQICFPDSMIIGTKDSLPSSLDNVSCLFIFSNSFSQFDDSDVEQITNFVINGGGLYLGADNWPLQSEANQMTKTIYNTESYGEFKVSNAEINARSGNLSLYELDSIPAGTTTVAFPLDPRLKVEAWVDDEPLILSGTLGDGRIIIDGGYSRFYCSKRSIQTDKILEKFVAFLSLNDWE